MKLNLLGIEIDIHPKDNRPQYDPMRHFGEVIQEKLELIQRRYERNKV